MDRLTAQQRHANMAAIRSKNTKAEIIVRRGLWKRGFRYRLNQDKGENCRNIAFYLAVNDKNLLISA